MRTLDFIIPIGGQIPVGGDLKKVKLRKASGPIFIDTGRERVPLELGELAVLPETVKNIVVINNYNSVNVVQLMVMEDGGADLISPSSSVAVSNLPVSYSSERLVHLNNYGGGNVEWFMGDRMVPSPKNLMSPLSSVLNNGEVVTGLVFVSTAGDNDVYFRIGTGNSGSSNDESVNTMVTCAFVDGAISKYAAGKIKVPWDGLTPFYVDMESKGIPQGQGIDTWPGFSAFVVVKTPQLL